MAEMKVPPSPGQETLHHVTKSCDQSEDVLMKGTARQERTNEASWTGTGF